MKRAMKLYFVIIGLTAIVMAMTNDIIQNFFKDAYNVTAFQRGLLEIPRETPGVLLILIVTSLAVFSDIRISMIAQLLSFIGITFLGFMTPSFTVMMIFVFINSTGMHLFFPMQDSIGMALAEPEKVGRRMGQYKGLFTGMEMFGAAIVFLGFRFNLFSFKQNIKMPFLIAAVLLLIIFMVFVYLNQAMHIEGNHPKKTKFVFRKEYKFYYALVVMYGVQKQMMMVYGPWVLIELLGKGTDVIAALVMVGLFVGIFFIPALGRWIDRFGVKKMLYADAISFVGVYFLYGLLCAGYVSGVLGTAGIPVILAYVLFIIDKMSAQMSIIRTVYLKKIAVEIEDITPTLSLGISLDHIMSITFAVLSGYIWTQFGPQYVFFLVSALSLVNVYVAAKLKIDKAQEV